MSPNPQEPGDLVTFVEEILNEKLHFFLQSIEISLQKFHTFVDSLGDL